MCPVLHPTFCENGKYSKSCLVRSRLVNTQIFRADVSLQFSPLAMCKTSRLLLVQWGPQQKLLDPHPCKRGMSIIIIGRTSSFTAHKAPGSAPMSHQKQLVLKSKKQYASVASDPPLTKATLSCLRCLRHVYLTGQKCYFQDCSAIA